MTVRTVVFVAVVSSIISAVVTSILVTLLLVGVVRPDTALAQVPATPSISTSPTVVTPGTAAGLSAVQPMVRAERFELVDAAGRVAARLGIEQGEPGLSLFDPNTGALRLWMQLMPDGRPVILLAGQTGRSRLELALAADEVPALVMLDQAGQSRLELELDANSVPELRMLDQSGQQRVGLVLAADGAPMLGLGTRLGAKTFVWGGARGLSGLTVEDQAGRGRLILAIRDDGTPNLVLLDESGQPVWQAP